MSKAARKVSNFPAGAEISVAEDESYVQLGPFRFYKFATAITTAVTAAPSGSSVGDLAITTHATGQGSIFKNIGGTWTAV